MLHYVSQIGIHHLSKWSGVILVGWQSCGLKSPQFVPNWKLLPPIHVIIKSFSHHFGINYHPIFPAHTHILVRLLKKLWFVKACRVRFSITTVIPIMVSFLYSWMQTRFPEIIGILSFSTGLSWKPYRDNQENFHNQSAFKIWSSDAVFLPIHLQNVQEKLFYIPFNAPLSETKTSKPSFLPKYPFQHTFLHHPKHQPLHSISL